MILYLDTSALVKAYITEEFSLEVLTAIKKAKIVASHNLAYVEAQATFARIRREKKLTEKEYAQVKSFFIEDWKNYLKIETTESLLRHASELAEAFSLRAYDSVHLAGADKLAKQTKKTILFGCFDNQLNKAAHILGLELIV
jgi:predicted nucleic acid-binding protein